MLVDADHELFIHVASTLLNKYRADDSQKTIVPIISIPIPPDMNARYKIATMLAKAIQVIGNKLHICVHI